jgi:hypothetical protein
MQHALINAVMAIVRFFRNPIPFALLCVLLLIFMDLSRRRVDPWDDRTDTGGIGPARARRPRSQGRGGDGQDRG